MAHKYFRYFISTKDPRNCMRCHEQCLKCTGSQQNECSKCRSFEYLHSENHRNPLLSATMTLKCVAKCPNGTYAQEQRCYSCNESCYEFGCRFFKNINGWNFNCINLDVLGQAPYLVFYIFTIGNICPFNPLNCILGPGGCDRCRYAVEEENHTKRVCFFTQPLSKT